MTVKSFSVLLWFRDFQTYSFDSFRAVSVATTSSRVRKRTAIQMNILFRPKFNHKDTHSHTQSNRLNRAEWNRLGTCREFTDDSINSNDSHSSFSPEAKLHEKLMNFAISSSNFWFRDSVVFSPFVAGVFIQFLFRPSFNTIRSERRNIFFSSAFRSQLSFTNRSMWIPLLPIRSSALSSVWCV